MCRISAPSHINQGRRHQSEYDVPWGLAIHAGTGEIFVTGTADSSNFPGTTGGIQAVFGGGREDAFVTRFSGDLRQR